MSEPLDQHRRRFPALAGKTYVNFGVYGVLADSTLEALTAHYRRRQEEGPAHGGIFGQQLDDDRATQAALGALLGVPGEEVALIDSSCQGCIAALLAIEWRRGDRLLLGDAEYPALVQFAHALARRTGLQVVTVPMVGCAHEAPARLAEAARAGARALLLSHVLWTTGERVDVAAVTAAVREAAPDCWLIVDGAQGPGNVECRPAAWGADAYAFAGHKALCGPDGVGGMWVSPRALAEWEPLTSGWRGVRVDALGRPAGWAPGARRFELATTTFGTRPALREALRVADLWGPLEERCARVQALAARAYHGLRTAGVPTFLSEAPRSSLVCLRLPDGAARVEALRARGILARWLPQTDVVRLSFSYLNTEEEVDAVVRACAG